MILTYGVLPSEADFLLRCVELAKEDGRRGWCFRNDPRLGYESDVSPERVWTEIQQAMREFEDSDGVLDNPVTDGWVSCIFEIVGIEWV